MAKKDLGSKATKNIFDVLAENGFTPSGLALWDEGETLMEEVKGFDFYVSSQYESSAFIVIREEGRGSHLISFGKGEINPEDWTSGDKGLVDPEDYDFTVTVKKHTAIRDDATLGKVDPNDSTKRLGIKKGDVCLKCYVD